MVQLPDTSMAKIMERTRARDLRTEGESIAEIARGLQVSKSTVSYWCRDITLSQENILQLAQKSKSGGTRGLLIAAEKKRVKRIEDTQIATTLGAQEVEHMSSRDIFFTGLGLYWGEGYKRGNEELGFTNSDPKMIKFIIHWLHIIYFIDKSDLIARVSINEQHAGRIAEVENYWSEVAGIPKTQFTRISLIQTRSKKIYSEPEKHFGTLRIKVRRGANLRRRILGSIQRLEIKET